MNVYEEIFENAVISSNLPLIIKLLEIKKFDPTFKDNRMLFLAAQKDHDSLPHQPYRSAFVNKTVKLLINVDSIRKKLILEGATNQDGISDLHISLNLYHELRELAFTIQIELINQEVQEKLKRMIKVVKELGIEEGNGESVFMLDPDDMKIPVYSDMPLKYDTGFRRGYFKKIEFLQKIAKMHLRGEELPGIPPYSELLCLECLNDKRKDARAKEELDLSEIVSEKPSYTPASLSSQKRERDEDVASSESSSQSSKRRRVEEAAVTIEEPNDEDMAQSYCRIA